VTGIVLEIFPINIRFRIFVITYQVFRVSSSRKVLQVLPSRSIPVHRT
jgi:hypothetical protein